MIEHVLHLLAYSDFHKDYTLNQINRCIVPPCLLKQHTGIVENGNLVAWCSWAFMTQDKAAAFLDGNYAVQRGDWNEGKTLVFMDFVAPFGHTRELFKKVRGLFPHYETAGYIRHAKNGRQVRIKNVK